MVRVERGPAPPHGPAARATRARGPIEREARRALQENSISVNKEKVTGEYVANASSLINGAYILLQRGKKNYFLVKA